MPAEKIELEDVVSSNLAAIGYNPLKRILAVQFKSGAIYHYADVDVLVAAGFNTAESKGRYYAASIKGQYQAQQMTGHCANCGDGPGWIGDRCQDCGTADYVPDPRKEEHGQTNSRPDHRGARTGASADRDDKGTKPVDDRPGAARGDRAIRGKVPRARRGGSKT
jgi:hypothetical protein